MKFSLSLSVAALVVAVSALDRTACSGMGACMDLAKYYETFVCGKAGSLNLQQSAQGVEALLNGEGSAASDAEFPADCYGAQPSATSVKLKVNMHGATFYGFGDYNCVETTPVTECYTSYKNRSLLSVCKVVMDGTQCVVKETS